MRRWTLRGRLLAAAVVPTLIITYVVGTFVERSKWHGEGRAQAERDIAAGKMKWKTYDVGLSELSGTKRVLAQYGLELEVIYVWVGYKGTTELDARTSGYNNRIEEELDRKFGAGTADQMHKAVNEQLDWRN